MGVPLFLPFKEGGIGRKGGNVWRGLIVSRIVWMETDQARGRTVSLNPSAFAALAAVEKEGFPLLDKALNKSSRVRPVSLAS